MNAYVNIGNMDFKDVLNDTYVDKSMLIAYMNGVLNTTSRYMCVTRARRFGKSLAAKMLCAYYDQSCNSRSLFANLKIAQHPSFETHLNQYPVIYLDATEFTSNLQSDDFSVAARKDYVMIRELPTGKGFADIVFIPRRNVNKPAIVIELKYNHSAESGLEQIKRKQYADSLRDYVGDVVLGGISYNDKTKHHSCLIEHVDKYNDKSAIKSLVGDKSAINSFIGDKLPADVDRDKCIMIIMYAQQHAIFKAQEISDLLGLQSSRTRDYLNALVVAELLQPHGANKNRTYTLK